MWPSVEAQARRSTHQISIAPSTVAGTLGHTLCGAARNGGRWEGTFGREPGGQLKLSRYCATNIRPSTTSDRRAPGCPTEHVLTRAHSFRSFERERTDVSGQRQRSFIFCR